MYNKNLHFYMKINGKEIKIYKTKKLNKDIILLSVKSLKLLDNEISAKNFTATQTA